MTKAKARRKEREKQRLTVRLRNYQYYGKNKDQIERLIKEMRIKEYI